MVQLVYLDETGSDGLGNNASRLLSVVAAVVDEVKVRPLSERFRAIAKRHLGGVPVGFEFHAAELWGGTGHWTGWPPPEKIAVFDDLVAAVVELNVRFAYASIDKQRLHDRHNGRYDKNAYLLALQFLLGKVDTGMGGDLKIAVADEAKEHQLRAVTMVDDLLRVDAGVVQGRKLTTFIEAVHFVDSRWSPGVQAADLFAFVLQRQRLAKQPHPNLDVAVGRWWESLSEQVRTWREPWPGGG